MPNTSPRLYNENGIQYAFDQARGKLLSTGKVYFRAGIKHRNVSYQFMRLEDGQPMMTVGDALPRQATIVGLTANAETSSSWNLAIYKKGSSLVIATLPVIATTLSINQTLNIDVGAGDVLQFKVEGNNVSYPRALLELAWRL